MKNPNFEQYITILKDWIPEDASIAIAIDQQYEFYRSGNHDVPIKIGQKIAEGSIAQAVYKNNKRVEALMNDSLFGVPYYGIGYPIYVGNHQGVLVVILPTSYHISQKEPLTFLTGKTVHDWFPVKIEEVSFIESKQKKTWFYSKEIEYSSIYTLKELTLMLPNSFLRVHRSFIVNIQYIERISRDFSSSIQLTLKDGSIIPVSQSYSNEIRKRLGF